jgi:hypothetical protein
MKQYAKDFYEEAGLFYNPYFLFLYFIAFLIYLFTHSVTMYKTTKEDLSLMSERGENFVLTPFLAVPVLITLHSYLLCSYFNYFYLFLIPLIIILFGVLAYLNMRGFVSDKILKSLKWYLVSLASLYFLHIALLVAMKIFLF